jgi:hypothetical protein
MQLKLEMLAKPSQLTADPGAITENCETEMIQAHTSIHHHDDTFEVVSNQLHVQNTQTDFASLGL